MTAELITSLFYPRSPLHDGGVIISGSRIAAAGCLFPLSQKEPAQKGMGTRHRAAIGIAEETDAVVVVVSEETGSLSIAYNGRIRRGIRSDRLQRILSSMLGRSQTGLSHFREKIEAAETELSVAPQTEKEASDA